MTPAEGGCLSTLDLILAAMDSSSRPLDFGIVLHLKRAPSLDALRAGARSARNLYSVTGSVIRGKRWIPTAAPADGVSEVASSDAVQEFFDRRLDPRQHAPLQQLVVIDKTQGGVMLVTRAHHAAADGLSVAMWLHHQFRVACGLEAPTIKPSAPVPVLTRGHSSPIRKSPLGYHGPAQRVWTRSSLSGGSRRWLTIEIPVRADDTAVLATAALETLGRWNRTHHAGTKRIGLWLPVSIRRPRVLHFGNGTSRIRVYPRYSADAVIADKRQEIRRQIRWGLKHGEWAVPAHHMLTQLPLWLGAPLLRLYLNRPWVDMGSSALSCAANWTGHDDAVFRDIEKIECVGQLHERYAVVLNGVSHGGKTWMTFTYDPERLTFTDIAQFADLYLEHLR
jgi:hypothetical protein